MGDLEQRENLFHTLSTRLLSQNLDVLCSILNRLFMEGRAWSILGPDLQLLVLEEEELYIDPVLRASIGKSMARTPYYTVRDPQPQPPPTEAVMAKEPEPVEYEEEDEKPVREVIPLDDIEKIDLLLDVGMKTVEMPNLAGIRQACQEELARINTELVKGQEQAQKEYQNALAEWEARQAAKAKAKQEEEKDDDA